MTRTPFGIIFSRVTNMLENIWMPHNSPKSCDVLTQWKKLATIPLSTESSHSTNKDKSELEAFGGKTKEIQSSNFKHLIHHWIHFSG